MGFKLLGAFLAPIKSRNSLGDFLVLELAIILLVSNLSPSTQANSINYGISQQPITDISQLVPTLCQNQSVICEGSFCIPGVKRCVCDLRQPVQLGQFCLRQIDIATKCFATNQCNHTIKDAVCMDLSSNSILDQESSMFKLEQWRSLNELKLASQSAMSTTNMKKVQSYVSTIRSMKNMYLVDEHVPNEPGFSARDDVIMSNIRNSPYEINYYTPELLQQNHTRRKNDNNGNKNPALLNLVSSDAPSPKAPSDRSRLDTDDNSRRSSTDNQVQSIITTQGTVYEKNTVESKTAIPIIETTAPSHHISTSASNKLMNLTTSSTPATSSQPNEAQRKKLVVKAPNWPPGICSCPRGFMFDSMLRKCLALSLVDSHCSSENDCKQIKLTHCSPTTKKCECDEPLIWNATDLACVRPRPRVTFIPEKAATPLLLSDLLPDQTIILLIFAIALIVVTLIISRLIVKCFSASKPTLISPKNQKNKKLNQNSQQRSPYATLRKADKPVTPFNNYAQTTRGRILNYDFEQDISLEDRSWPRPVSASDHSGHQSSREHEANEKAGTLSRLKGLKHSKATSPDGANNQQAKNPEVNLDESLDLNELDSESKSELSMAVPPQATTNQPTYMLAGQQSAIAAAAAAVANRRNFGKPEFV